MSIRDKLCNFLLVFDPKQINSLDTLISQSEGDEDALCGELSVRYNTKYLIYYDALIGFFDEFDLRRKKDIPKLLIKYRSREEETLFRDLDVEYGCGYFSTRRRLAAYFLRVDPERVKDINSLLSECKTQEKFNDLLNELSKQYQTQHEADLRVMSPERQKPIQICSSPKFQWTATVDSGGDFRPFKLLPSSSCFTDSNCVTVIRLCHRESGRFVKFPSRCDTRCELVQDYSEASDAYIVVGEAGHMTGICIQSCNDGRMLSEDCCKRTWSPSPPRIRLFEGFGSDVTVEYQLHTRRFGVAELCVFTEFNEIKSLESGKYAYASINNDNGLWLSNSRMRASAFDIIQSKPSQQRQCRHCKEWYNCSTFTRCLTSVSGQHESWLLPEWQHLDQQLRDSTLHGVGVPSLPLLVSSSPKVLSSIFSYMGLSDLFTVSLVCKTWHQITTSQATTAGNPDWTLATCLSAASTVCNSVAEEGKALPPRGLFANSVSGQYDTLYGISDKGIHNSRVNTVLRHAATIASPECMSLIYNNDLWTEGSSDTQSVARSKAATTSSIDTEPRRNITCKSSESLCFTALICRKVEDCLRSSRFPSDPNTVHTISSSVSRSLTAHQMIRAFDNPANMYAVVCKAAQRAGIQNTSTGH